MIRKLLAALVIVAANLNVAAQKDGKAILFVHYGTTSDEMRQRSLDAINSDVKKAFPDVEFMEAYTSPVVIKSLAKKGITVPTPMEALMTLRGKGIKDVTVQSSMLMNGGQTDFITLETEKMRPFFDALNVGKPLLYTIGDSRFITDWLSTKYSGAAQGKGDAVVFVGHGGDNPGTAIYSQLGEMLAGKQGNFYVATIEGYPSLGDLVAKMKKDNIKNVTLVPLLIVGGNHIRKDIDGEWKTSLEKEGFKVKAEMISLGEETAVREWIVGKIRQSMEKSE